MQKCDLVMKGGITSGIVFPKAIEKLSDKYEFKNIAGTSAGAIAAALAAAAEYGRKTGGNTGAFPQLGDLSGWLGKKSDKTHKLRLLQLFQPSPETTPVLRLALMMIGPKCKVGKTLGAVRIILFSSWAALLGMVPGLLALAVLWGLGRSDALHAILPGLGVAAASLGAALVVFLLLGIKVRDKGLPLGVRLGLSALVLLAAWVYLARAIAAPEAARPWVLPVALALTLALAGFVRSAVARFVSRLAALPDNFFGMCTGLKQQSGGGDDALTPWLHEQIQKLAGLPLDKPLTFGHLEAQGINLRTMTSCITHGRPYLLPFSDGGRYFDLQEVGRLFPPEVVNHLQDAGERSAASPNRSPQSQARVKAMSPLLPLPRDGEFPVLLAARMSLSFPFLLAAVPLWSIDFQREENSQASNNGSSVRASDNNGVGYVPEQVWYSDGGLCSNFPVHLFDQMIPAWPTFAINLRYFKGELDPTQRAQMVATYSEGKRPVWQRMVDAGAARPGGLGSFAGSLISTMQNWVDNTAMVVPGYTDRIAHVGLGKGEGGLNLDMPESVVNDIASRGAEAAEELIQRFHTPANGPMTWDTHRWTRFRSSLSVLQGELEGLRATYQQAAPNWDALIQNAWGNAPYEWQWVGQPAEAMQALQDLDAMLNTIAAGRGFNNPSDRGIPNPKPELQLRPPL